MALLTNRSFMTVWGAGFVSGLGDKIAVIALFSLILDRTGSVAGLGLLAAAQILPGVLLGPVAGLLIDRWSRRGAMIAGDLLGAAAVLLISFSGMVWPVYALAVLLAVGRQLAGPARLALVPDLVEPEALGRTNALAMFSQNVILLLGMAAGGVIVETLGSAAALRIDAITFLVSAGMLILHRIVFPRDAGSRADRPRSGWRDIRDGARWLWGHRPLRFAVLFLGVTTMVTAMQPPLVFGFVRNVLGRGEGELGLIFAAAGVGGLLGAVAAGALRRSHRPLAVVTTAVAIDGALLLLFALNRDPMLAALIFGLFGAISTLIQANLATFLQKETPRERRGRIFGWLTPMLGPVSLASVLIGPGLARVAGVVTVLGAAGALEMLIGAIGRVRLPTSGSSGSGALPGNSGDLNEMHQEG